MQFYSNFCWFDSYIFVGQWQHIYLDQNLQAFLCVLGEAIYAMDGKTKRWKIIEQKGGFSSKPCLITATIDRSIDVFHGPSMTQDKHQLTPTLFGQH